MARTRLKKTLPCVPIASLDDADAALAELARLQRLETEIKNALNAGIDELKDQAKSRITPLDERMGDLTRGLNQYATNQRAELFKTRKSVELLHGEFGYRKSTTLKTQPKFTWAKVLGKLKELGFGEGVRSKEDVNKEALHQWSDEKLALVGARRVSAETFWYEVKEQDLPDVE